MPWKKTASQIGLKLCNNLCSILNITLFTLSRKCVEERIYVRMQPPFNTKDYVTKTELVSKHDTKFCWYISCLLAKVISQSYQRLLAQTADTINQFRIYEALQTISSSGSQEHCERGLNSFKQRQWVSIEGVSRELTHWGLMTSFGVGDLGQHWFR